MAKGVAHVTRWLLDQSPEIIRKLEREGGEGLFVLVGDSKKLGLNKVRLIVPQGIVVYQAIRDFRNMGELFFSVADEGDMARAYSSCVTTRKEGGLNYMHNVGKLLEYPWFNHQDSSELFDRISHSGKKSNLYLVNLAQQDGPHPLL